MGKLTDLKVKFLFLILYVWDTHVWNIYILTMTPRCQIWWLDTDIVQILNSILLFAVLRIQGSDAMKKALLNRVFHGRNLHAWKYRLNFSLTTVFTFSLQLHVRKIWAYHEKVEHTMQICKTCFYPFQGIRGEDQFWKHLLLKPEVGAFSYQYFSMEFFRDVSLNSLNSVTKIFVITVKVPATSCARDQDAITASERHIWETGSSNWSQFMLQWFDRLIEFAEFSGIPATHGKNSNVICVNVVCVDRHSVR